MEWTEETIETLRALWKEGHSTAEIGRRLGVTKNAVVGKAHRLKLSSRPSPIRRDRLPGELRRRSASRPRPSMAGERPTSREQGPSAPKPLPVLRSIPTIPTPSYGRVCPCCWPIGEPGTKTFHFCDVDTLPGKPYCAEHAQIAYVRVKDRRETAA
jgi:GcrA cell cycle regulator